ncbi:uncharacterized protein LOC116614896 isoform X3 [Nematostella vectensis]|uniref:uncharacterized protein LOC116614896 isoform X3 n=1 Tax=Nematostella vectensis TaxID=45351 RepID=UPI0020778523|nr:uncharacterized protein LOC116614896 isoform X3 [Nematostella vectensis]
MREFLSTGKHDLCDQVPRTVQAKDVNRRAVFAASEVGLGREGIKAICEIFDMPPPVNVTAWATHEHELLKQQRVAVQEMLEDNRKELQQSDIENTKTPAAVSFDGTWAKRGFTSNHGVGFAISADTGKVIDYSIVSKSCNACKLKLRNLSEAEYEEWRATHDCPGDYEGSSPSMETACAKQIWERSKSLNLEYRYMVSDGDSKAFNEIWDTYGVCDSCKTHHSLDKSSKEYKEWRDSEEYKKSEDEHALGSTECRRVEKLDCINHVSKRMGKALRTVQEKRGKLPDGKPVGGRSGRLTTKTIQKLQNYYGKAIRNNVKKGILSADEKLKAVKAMKREIKAGLYHSCKLPSKERHKFCPENSWCSFKTTGREVAPKSHHLDPVFCAHLEPIYDRLSEENLLRRCLGGYTQNPNESVNSLVWSRCPKHKWFGRGRVEMAVVSAALQFSAGATAKHRVMSLAGIPPGSSTMKASSRRDSLRVQKAETRSTEQYKSSS